MELDPGSCGGTALGGPRHAFLCVLEEDYRHHLQTKVLLEETITPAGRWFRDKALCRAVAWLSVHHGAVPGQLLHTHIGVVQPERSVFSPQMGSGILINVTKFRASLLGFDGFRVGSSHVLYSRGTSPPPAPELVRRYFKCVRTSACTFLTDGNSGICSGC